MIKTVFVPNINCLVTLCYGLEILHSFDLEILVCKNKFLLSRKTYHTVRSLWDVYRLNAHFHSCCLKMSYKHLIFMLSEKKDDQNLIWCNFIRVQSVYDTDSATV